MGVTSQWTITDTPDPGRRASLWRLRAVEAFAICPSSVPGWQSDEGSALKSQVTRLTSRC